MAPAPADERPASGLDEESQAWIDALTTSGSRREEALRDLHALLLRAARFEVRRRRSALAHASVLDSDDLATQAADDALVSVLAHLHEFRGLSRFTTWAYKFALLEAAVKARRAVWRDREVPMAPEDWALLPGGDSADRPVLDAALAAGLRTALRDRAGRGAFRRLESRSTSVPSASATSRSRYTSWRPTCSPATRCCSPTETRSPRYWPAAPSPPSSRR